VGDVVMGTRLNVTGNITTTNCLLSISDISTNSNLNVGGNGKINGSIGIHYNITERKIIESDLKKSLEIEIERNKRLLNISNIVSNNLETSLSNVTSLLGNLKKSESDVEIKEIIEHLSLISSQLNDTLSNLKS
jgi:hypothetical protein